RRAAIRFNDTAIPRAGRPRGPPPHRGTPTGAPPMSRVAAPSLVIALACSLTLTPVAPAEEVEHPAFKSWARHPIGTSVTTRTVTTSLGRTITTTTTYKLLEVRADKAVLETRTVSDATGTTVEGLPSKYDQQRMFPVFPGVKKEDIGKPT